MGGVPPGFKEWTNKQIPSRRRASVQSNKKLMSEANSAYPKWSEAQRRKNFEKGIGFDSYSLLRCLTLDRMILKEHQDQENSED